MMQHYIVVKAAFHCKNRVVQRYALEMVQHYTVVKAAFHCKNRVVYKGMPLKWCNITLWLKLLFTVKQSCVQRNAL